MTKISGVPDDSKGQGEDDMTRRLGQSLVILFALCFSATLAWAQEEQKAVLEEEVTSVRIVVFEPTTVSAPIIGLQFLTPSWQFKTGCSEPTTVCMRFSCSCRESCEPCGIAQLNCGEQICVCNC
jgi:hypothetical protein